MNPRYATVDVQRRDGDALIVDFGVPVLVCDGIERMSAE